MCVHKTSAPKRTEAVSSHTQQLVTLHWLQFTYDTNYVCGSVQKQDIFYDTYRTTDGITSV